MANHHQTPAETNPGRSPRNINWRAFEYYTPLRKLVVYLRENPDAELTLTSAAAVAVMEETNFSKFFAKKTGMKFKYWNDARRVERAQRAFDVSDISVADAAFSAGFHDLTTFARAFKRITGMTPREYKKRAANDA